MQAPTVFAGGRCEAKSPTEVCVIVCFWKQHLGLRPFGNGDKCCKRSAQAATLFFSQGYIFLLSPPGNNDFLSPHHTTQTTIQTTLNLKVAAIFKKPFTLVISIINPQQQGNPRKLYQTSPNSINQDIKKPSSPISRINMFGRRKDNATAAAFAQQQEQLAMSSTRTSEPVTPQRSLETQAYPDTRLSPLPSRSSSRSTSRARPYSKRKAPVEPAAVEMLIMGMTTMMRASLEEQARAKAAQAEQAKKT